jgi:hypothetical protein
VAGSAARGPPLPYYTEASTRLSSGLERDASEGAQVLDVSRDKDD